MNNTIDWLLEEENPSARCLALRQVVGRPEDDPQVTAAREVIPGWGPARAILDAQWPAGYWVAPGAGYSPRHKATVWQILFLAALGAPLTPAIERACDYLLTHGRLPDGRFTAGKTARGAVACLNGGLLRAMIELGYLDHRVEDSLEALAEMVRRDRFCCRLNAPRPCVSGAVKALGALVVAPAPWRSTTVQEAAEAAAGFLLTAAKSGSRPRWSEGEGDRWDRFGFPPDDTADLLEALDVLGRAGVSRPDGLDDALALVRGRRGADGTWRLEHTPRNTWATFGRVGQPNKWVTIRALAVLQRWDTP